MLAVMATVLFSAILLFVVLSGSLENQVCVLVSLSHVLVRVRTMMIEVTVVVRG